MQIFFLEELASGEGAVAFQSLSLREDNTKVDFYMTGFKGDYVCHAEGGRAYLTQTRDCLKLRFP